MTDVGPFGRDRARYFADAATRAAERRRQADVEVNILEHNLRVELARLHGLERRHLDDNLGPARRAELDRALARQARHIDDIRAELAAQRRRRTKSHRDQLIEWELEHGHRPRPTPGRYLLARRSTKPFPTHPTA